MKKLILILMLFSFFLLTAQQNEIETADSLLIDVKSDSLLVLENADSLRYIVVDGDTIFAKTEDAEEIGESQDEVVEKIDLGQLATDLQKHIEQKQIGREKQHLPFVFYRENFHFSSPFDPNFITRKNGFSILQHYISNIHIFQNYYPLYNSRFSQGFLDLKKDNYNLPVAVTESFLGLGDENMNQAAVSYKKGTVFGIKKLHVEADYIGQDGYWLGKREKSRNFDLHLFYEHFWGKLHFYYTIIDQEISSNKLFSAPELAEVEIKKENSSEAAVKWENKFFTVGLRQQQTEVDSLKQTLKSILLTKEISYKQHQVEANYEYCSMDDDFSILTILHESNLEPFVLSNNFYFREQNNYYLNSLLQFHLIKNLALLANYEKSGSKNILPFWQEERMAGGLQFFYNGLNLKLIAGNETIHAAENHFIEAQTDFHTQISKFSIFIKNWTLYRTTDDPEIPEFQTQLELEINLNLKYNNKIKFGVKNSALSKYGYFQDFSEGLVKNDFSSLDAWLGIQITDRFQIQVDAVNLLNAEELYGLPTSYNLPETHFNINVYWLFVN